jgi:DNA-binding NarL/FixJ family response regulator
MPPEGPLEVVLATDSFLIGDGLACLLGGVEEVHVVGRARTHEELLDVVDRLHPQAVIISIRTPLVATMATIRSARQLRVSHPELGIVVIADRGNGYALELLRAGASRIAYLLDGRLPEMQTILAALHEVMAGQTVLDPTIVDALVHRRNSIAIDDLTVRELDVLELVAQGLSNRAIAAELSVSPKAVEKYVTGIFRKLALVDGGSVDRRVAAALVYLRAQSDPFGAKAHQAPPG